MAYKIILICIFIFILLLRLPSLFEPFSYSDEGIYLTLGQAMKQGEVLYRDIHDNKPPLLYLLAAITGNFSYYRLLLFGWSLITIYIFFKLSQHLFLPNQRAVIASTAVFALLISIHAFEGNVANAENFMLLPTIAGFLLILKGLKSKRILHFFFAGILFSLASLFKIPAAFDFLGAMVYIFLISFKDKKSIANYLISALTGFALPILATLIYFKSQNALQQYLSAAFFQNIPYLSSWTQNKTQLGGLPLPLLTRSFLLLFLISSLYIFRERFSKITKLILLWFSLSLFSALLSSRPYPHYLLQAMPSIALSLGLIFQKGLKKIIPLFLVIIFSLSFFLFHFWHYSNISYYLNFYQFALKMKDREKYFSYFDHQAITIYQTADFIQNHTLPEEKIFIWGNQPSIYALSRRLPAGRYTTSYHIVDFNGYQETIANLKKEKPSFIIKMRNEKRKFPAFENILNSSYIKAKTIGQADIYKRI